MVYWLHTDHLGSLSLITDHASRVIAQRRFLPYGGERYSEGTFPTDVGFTGHRGQAGLGLVFMRARYYHPYLNRWIQPDTIVPDPANPQSLNRYSYVFGNPLKYVDPTGYDPLDSNWENEFQQHHGRSPEEYDRLIRLFSIAFPDEWNGDYGWGFFYNEDGTYKDGSLQRAFTTPGQGRSWVNMPDVLGRLAGWYQPDESAKFVRDIGTLFGGMPDRFSTPLEGAALRESFGGPVQEWGWAGLGPDGLPEFLTGGDWDHNAHHWAACFVLGYYYSVLGIAGNTGREFLRVATAQGWQITDENVADLWLGNRAVLMGGEFSFRTKAGGALAGGIDWRSSESMYGLWQTFIVNAAHGISW